MDDQRWQQLLALLVEFGDTELDQFTHFRLQLAERQPLFVRLSREVPGEPEEAYPLVELSRPIGTLASPDLPSTNPDQVQAVWAVREAVGSALTAEEEQLLSALRVALTQRDDRERQIFND